MAVKKLSERSKKMGKWKGENNPFYGLNHTLETKNKISHSKSKIVWEVTTPSGEVTYIKNLNQYCKKNNLRGPHMLAVASGARKHHKGYSCRKTDLPLSFLEDITHAN